MRIPYEFHLTSAGVLEITRNEAETVRMILDHYLAGASLGKVVDMLLPSKYLLQLGKQNGLGQRLTIFFPTLNILLLVALNPSRMYNLKNPPVVMSTMTRQAHPVNQLAIVRPLCSKYNFYFQSPKYLLQ